MSLTKNFSLAEFTYSSTAASRNIANTPTPAHLLRIQRHAQVMQIIRDEIGLPISITSGYRNPTVNKLVGGVANSDHANGDASDSAIMGLTAYTYAKKIVELMRPGQPLHGKIDQVILETSRNVVHVSTAPRLRGQALTQPQGPGTPFMTGIQQ